MDETDRKGHSAFAKKRSSDMGTVQPKNDRPSVREVIHDISNSSGEKTNEFPIKRYVYKQTS